MALCIIPSNFRLITEILKELEWECHSVWTDRRMAEHNDRRQYASAPMAAEGKNVFELNGMKT